VTLSKACCGFDATGWELCASGQQLCTKTGSTAICVTVSAGSMSWQRLHLGWCIWIQSPCSAKFELLQSDKTAPRLYFPTMQLAKFVDWHIDGG
jgi:hypothetical protein